jgi:hypothetical protein
MMAHLTGMIYYYLTRGCLLADDIEKIEVLSYNRPGSKNHSNGHSVDFIVYPLWMTVVVWIELHRYFSFSMGLSAHKDLHLHATDLYNNKRWVEYTYAKNGQDKYDMAEPKLSIFWERTEMLYPPNASGQKNEGIYKLYCSGIPDKRIGALIYSDNFESWNNYKYVGKKYIDFIIDNFEVFVSNENKTPLETKSAVMTIRTYTTKIKEKVAEINDDLMVVTKIIVGLSVAALVVSILGLFKKK